MNNLKRVLSLALSGIMLVGMMAMGASAAEFSDADTIEHTDAVNTLVALNIINGQDDGSFNPEGDVTRAQMAKMIAVAMNGGTETSTGVKGTASFTDIKGHWAESYIEYCYDLGIISGRGDGTFDPEGKVTAIEATKMVLTALGYDSEAYELTGPKWATQADQLARMAQPTLYEELLGMTLTAPASRDTAAQLIWNGMQNETVRIKPNQDRDSSGKTSWGYDKTGVTLLKERYNGEVREAYLTGVSYDADSKTFTYGLTNTNSFGAETIALPASGGNGVTGNFDYSEDVSELFGQKVKVVYKANKTKDVYSIFASGSAVIADAVVGKDLKVDPADKSVKLNNVSYKFSAWDGSAWKATAADVPVYNFLDSTSTENLDDLKAATAKHIFAAKVIDNDDDGKINCVVITPIEVAKVTFVGKNSITAGTGVYKFEDCDIYEDVKKDDWAVITDEAFVSTGVDTVVKAELVNGTIDATREVGTEAKIGDTWYTDAPAGKSGDDYVVDEEFNLTVVNKYVIDAKAVTSATDVSNAVYVLKADPVGETGTTKEGIQSLQLLFADDSRKVVTVDEIDGEDVVETGTPNGTRESGEVLALTGEVYTYSVKKNGNYKLTSIGANDFDVNDDKPDGSNNIAIDEGRVTATAGLDHSYRVDANAVVFVKYTHNGSKVKAVTGAAVNKWKDATATSAAANNSIWADKDNNGFYCIRLAKFDLGSNDLPSNVGELSYGWVTKKPEVVKDGDYWYIRLVIWNGEEEVTVLTEENSSKMELMGMTNADPYKRGCPISYDDIGGNMIDNAASLRGKINGVAGYNEDKDIEFRTATSNGTTGDITKDTVIIYVDMADNEGAEGGSIVLAPVDANGVALNNCYADINAQGEVVYIFVDVNNDIGSKYTVYAGGTVNGTTVARVGTGDLTANSTVTYSFKSTGAAFKGKVTYGTQTKIVDIPASGGTAVEVDFVKEVGNDAVSPITIAKQVSYTDIAEISTAVNGQTATAAVASGTWFEGDTVKVTVTLTGDNDGNAGAVTLKTGGNAPTGIACTGTAPTGYTAGSGSYTITASAAAASVEFNVTATIGEETLTIDLT